MVGLMHGDTRGPQELEKVLSYVSFDDKGCIDFSAFVRLSIICKSLVQPLERGLRRELKKLWLGERFWAAQELRREAVERERQKDIGELFKSGYFTTELFLPEEAQKPKAFLSLSQIRQLASFKKKKEQMEERAETPAPVGSLRSPRSALSTRAHALLVSSKTNSCYLGRRNLLPHIANPLPSAAPLVRFVAVIRPPGW